MKSQIKFQGVYTALVTPMLSGKISMESFSRLLNDQVEQGVDGIVLLGTTGEAPTVSNSERKALITTAKTSVKGKTPIIVGVGSNCTAQTIQNTIDSDNAGADAIQIVAPYYNKPTQEGLFRHFDAVAQCTEKPIMLYSIQSRCGIEISISTIQRLRDKHPHIVTIKDCTASCDRISELKRSLDKDFQILAGDDSATLPFMSLGATGIVSVASNLIARELCSMVNLALQNNFNEAAKIHHEFYPLFKGLFIEGNPGPIKYALYRQGLISSPELRLPMVPLLKENQLLLDQILDKLDIKRPLSVCC